MPNRVTSTLAAIAAFLFFATAGCDSDVETTPTEASACSSDQDCDVGKCVAYATGQSVCVTDSAEQIGPAGQPAPPADLLQPHAPTPRAAQPGSDR